MLAVYTTVATNAPASEPAAPLSHRSRTVGPWLMAETMQSSVSPLGCGFAGFPSPTHIVSPPCLPVVTCTAPYVHIACGGEVAVDIWQLVSRVAGPMCGVTSSLLGTLPRFHFVTDLPLLA